MNPSKNGLIIGESKGKRVRIWLIRGMRYTKKLIPFNDSLETNLLEIVEGVISEIIESPFGIMLKDLSLSDSEKY